MDDIAYVGGVGDEDPLNQGSAVLGNVYVIWYCVLNGQYTLKPGNPPCF